MKLLSNIIYMWVIVESISARLSINLINKYIINKLIFETCIPEKEEEVEEGSEAVSVATGISDSSASTHHVHF